MCGIAGMWNRDGRPADRSMLLRMRDVISHRGPDDAGLHLDADVGLAHRRLSILDLSASGHQPMCNEDGSLWLVFNGEIYNYLELRSELVQRGHVFRSSTDTEVILHLYEERGVECLSSLNGMFAFALWDSRRRRFFLARDRVGIKPLYISFLGECFLFASEIKSLLEHHALARRCDERSVADYLFCGTPQQGRTFFKEVEEILPGHALTVEQGVSHRWEYWRPIYDYRRERPQATVDREIGELVDDAVRVHSRSDAPLGCHLSGGLDSSTVAALARRHNDPLKTFTIRFDLGGQYDESPYAKCVAGHIGAEYIEDSPDASDLVDRLAYLLWHADQPMMGPGGFSYWTGSRLASRFVKVALTGHGGDEIFGGYPAQFLTSYGTTGMFDVSGRLKNPRVSIIKRLRQAYGRRGLWGTLRRLVPGLRPGVDPSASWLAPYAATWVQQHCGYRPGDDPTLDPGFHRVLAGYDPIHPYLEHLVDAPTDELFDRCLHHDLRTYLPGLLQQEDRASMSVSLESRVPLLDYRIIEYLATVPPEQKVPTRIPKELLRGIASRLLPEQVWQRRDKGAFAVPTQHWFSGPLGHFVRELLHSERFLDRGIFAPDPVRSDPLVGDHVWGLLNIEIWSRIFLDRDPEWIARVERGRERAT